MCDTIDMNTLAEGEECVICMEEMAVEKCYRSDTNLHTQGCHLNLNSASYADILSALNVSDDWATILIQFLTTKQGQSNALIAAKSVHGGSVKLSHILRYNNGTYC